MKYDVFICHASEDKEDFVRPLAEALREAHVEVWYDEFSLSVGDSLRRSIDAGLLHSRHGIVVLSQHFFQKQWAQRELDGLTARQLNDNHKVILPIWHNISQKEVLEYSPPLADAVAVDSKVGLNTVCEKLLQVIRPEGSPLIVARDLLISYGLEVPVITDEWWLDIVAESSQTESERDCFRIGRKWHFPYMSNNWAFPLPNGESGGRARGIHLGWTAMQLNWMKNAVSQKISRITHPEQIHEFIKTNPGLMEICNKYPDCLIQHAPQLTIKGFSGKFEEIFDLILEESVADWKDTAEKCPGYRRALGINNVPPLCDAKIALRHSTLGDYKQNLLCDIFFETPRGMDDSHHDIDYLIWLTLPESTWLPSNLHEHLLEGMIMRNIWTGGSSFHWKDIGEGRVGSAFADAIARAKTLQDFKYTKRVQSSLVEMIEYSLSQIGSTVSIDSAYKFFLGKSIVERHFEQKALRRELRVRKK